MKLRSAMSGVLIAASVAGGATAAAAEWPTVGTITTFVGIGVAGFGGDGSLATTAGLNRPLDVALDAAGTLYISDSSNKRIRKVDAATGVITTIAGGNLSSNWCGDGGQATAACLLEPKGIALAGSNALYFVDALRVRRVDLTTGIITTVAGNGSLGSRGDGGQATAAELYLPADVAADGQGNLFISEGTSIRRVDATTNIITTFASALQNPSGLALDGGHLLVVDETTAYSPLPAGGGQGTVVPYQVKRLSRIDLSNGAIQPLATASWPHTGNTGFAGVGVDASGAIDIVDSVSGRVRKYNPSAGTLDIIAGTTGFSGSPSGGDGGPATAALMYPSGLAVGADGTIYVSEAGGHRVRRITPPTAATSRIATVAGSSNAGFTGDGPALTTLLNSPTQLVFDSSGNLYVNDTFNRRVRKITRSGTVVTVAGNGVYGTNGDGGPATSATFAVLSGIAVDHAGNVYVSDWNAMTVRRIDAATGIITIVAGTGVGGFSGDGGPAVAAQILSPRELATDGSGNVYIADTGNNRIRKVTVATGIITTVAGTGVRGSSGDGSLATSALLDQPESIAVDSAGNLYIGESSFRLRKVTVSTQVISTIAGTGVNGYSGENALAQTAMVSTVRNLKLDSGGNIYFVDGARIRKITATTGIITTVAGNGERTGTAADGSIATAVRGDAAGLAADDAGNLYFTLDHQIRKAEVPRVAPAGLTLMRYGATGVLLSWTPSAGNTGYLVNRGVASGAETPLVPVGANAAYITGTRGTRYFFTVTARYGWDETETSNEVAVVLTAAAARTDTDADGQSDVLIYRPSDGYWFSRDSASAYRTDSGRLALKWGAPGDIPLQADFDGDGRLDPTVYRPSVGQWFARLSSLGYDATRYQYFAWGLSTDTPFTADFDGDGRSDVAVYRPSSGDWYVLLSSVAYQPGVGAPTFLHWGGNPGDVPLVGDFDADGRADVAIYRGGSWFILCSSLGYDAAGYEYYGWGTDTDVPIVADFDGDARADIGVYRQSNGYWYLRLSSEYYALAGGNWIFQWGASGDEPKLGDFDADGKIDIAVYRPSSGQWFIRYSSLGYDVAQFGYFEWGAAGDVTVP